MEIISFKSIEFDTFLVFDSSGSINFSFGTAKSVFGVGSPLSFEFDRRSLVSVKLRLKHFNNLIQRHFQRFDKRKYIKLPLGILGRRLRRQSVDSNPTDVGSDKTFLESKHFQLG